MNKSYLTRLLFACILVVVGCFFFHRLLLFCNTRYFKAFERTEELFQGKTNYDILFLGSSRMKNHANPKIIDSILQINSFNGGQNACTVIEANLILQSYLATHASPQVVTLGLDVFSLNTTTNKVGYYPTYLPYMHQEEVNKILKSQGVNTTLLKTFSFLHPIEYNDLYKSSILKVALKQRELSSNDFYYKGFESNSTEVFNASLIEPSKPQRMGVDTAAIKSLEELVETCKKRQIKLIFIYAPEYKGMNWKSIVNADSIFHIYNNVSRRFDVPFYRDDSLAISTDSLLFRNAGHLNTKGAEYYSALLSYRLKPLLKQKSYNADENRQ